eukprot:3048512-Prymnesium_polylepis.1
MSNLAASRAPGSSSDPAFAQPGSGLLPYDAFVSGTPAAAVVQQQTLAADGEQETRRAPAKALTVRVGPTLERVEVPCDSIPLDSCVGAFARQQTRVGEQQHLDLPARDAAFFRLLSTFWHEAKRSVPAAYTQYQVVFETFVESLGGQSSGDGSGVEGLSPQAAQECVIDCCRAEAGGCQFIALSLARREPAVIPSINRALAAHLDATNAIERSRVTLALRGDYLLIDPADEKHRALPTAWAAATPAPSVVNEMRVRCVQHPPVHGSGEAAGGCFFTVDDEDEVSLHTRVLPAFTLWGCTGEPADGGAPRWHPILKSARHFGGALEARLFAVGNAPRRPRCSPAIEGALFALDDAL